MDLRILSLSVFFTVYTATYGNDDPPYHPYPLNSTLPTKCDPKVTEYFKQSWKKNGNPQKCFAQPGAWWDMEMVSGTRMWENSTCERYYILDSTKLLWVQRLDNNGFQKNGTVKIHEEGNVLHMQGDHDQHWNLMGDDKCAAFYTCNDKGVPINSTAPIYYVMSNTKADAKECLQRAYAEMEKAGLPLIKRFNCPGDSPPPEGIPDEETPDEEISDKDI